MSAKPARRGAKGAVRRGGQDPTVTMDKIIIEGAEVRAISPEGAAASMSVEAWVTKLAPPRMDTSDLVLPDGLKMIRSEGPATIWVHQSPPRVYSFRWIEDHSPRRFGSGTSYRTVRIALPYLIVFAVFCPGEDGRMTLSRSNECFFRNAPLESRDDELLYPALLNCSKFTPGEGKPLSWICTQHMQRPFDAEEDLNRRFRAGFKALLQCLLETGFNYSSEHHEGSSWFTESRAVDPRLSEVGKWEAATEEDPLFVLDIAWLKTGHTVHQVLERTFRMHKAIRPAPTSAAALARLVFNHAKPQTPTADELAHAATLAMEMSL